MNLELFYFLLAMFILVTLVISLVASKDPTFTFTSALTFGLTCGSIVVAALAFFFGLFAFYGEHLA